MVMERGIFGAEGGRICLNAARRGIGARGAVGLINYIGKIWRACRWVLVVIRGIVGFRVIRCIGERAKKGSELGSGSDQHQSCRVWLVGR